MDFDKKELFPQYNHPEPPSNCPREYYEDDEVTIPGPCSEEHCQVFVCPFMPEGVIELGNG